MAQEIIGVGAVANDGTGDTWRASMVKTNNNFTELFVALSAQAQNVVIINSESDFPTQTASTITLEANTQYFIGAAFSTAKTFTVEDAVTLKSIGPFFLAITYTGSGTMFNSSSTNWELNSIRLDCASGTLFNITGPFIFLMSDVQVLSCTNIGNITASGIAPNTAVIDNCAIFSISNQGLDTAGAFVIMSISQFFAVSTLPANIMIDLATATFQDIELDNLQLSGASGSVAISGAASSGNIISGALATVTNSRLDGDAMVALSGISQNDIRWAFAANSGVSDTRNAADSFLTVLETVTISVATTFVQVNGSNWSTTVSDRFTSATTGIVTYVGERDLEVKISGYATVAKVGGGTDELEIRFALNGTTLERSGGTTQNADPTSVPLEALVALTNGDEINFYVANNTSTSNVEVSKASLVIVSA